MDKFKIIFCDESITAVAEWLAYSIIYVIAMACQEQRPSENQGTIEPNQIVQIVCKQLFSKVLFSTFISGFNVQYG